jgi:hypothetical protein
MLKQRSGAYRAYHAGHSPIPKICSNSEEPDLGLPPGTQSGDLS